MAEEEFWTRGFLGDRRGHGDPRSEEALETQGKVDPTIWVGRGGRASGRSGRGGYPRIRDTPLEDGDLTPLKPRVLEG